MFESVWEVVTRTAETASDTASAWFLDAASALDFLGREGWTLLLTYSAELIAIAGRKPEIAVIGIAALGLTLLVTRNLLVFCGTAFLTVAALLGSEPVTEELRRTIFWIGCFATIAAYLLALFIERRRTKRARTEREAQRALLEQLREKYEAEVRWRMAERKPPPPSEKPSGLAAHLTQAKPAEHRMADQRMPLERTETTA